MNKKAKRNMYILGGGALAVAVLAYVSTAKKLIDLSITPTNVGFGKISKGILPIVLDIAIVNPNTNAVSISEITGNASIKGSIVGAFSLKKDITLPGKNTRTVLKKIVINVLLQEAGMSYLTNLLSGEQMEVTISGFLYAEGKQYPFSKTLKTNG